MTPLFGPDRLTEAEVPPATSGGTGQKIRVGVIERDNGLVMAKTSQINNALYDLADTNSTTHTVVLPHGTTVKLVAAVSNNVGSWRARFEITNPKLGKTVEEKGASAAAELAGQIDLLALNKIDKNALAKVTEAHDAGDHEGMLVALGLREAPLEEIQIHVSGYVTKSGKHVGAYSQIRKKISSLGPGQTLHFPDGISVRKSSGGYVVGGSNAPQLGGVTKKSAKAAADDVARKSAGSTNPKSLGGRVAHSIDSGSEVDALPNSGDNPKLPGAPHPADVADRAAKARKEATKRLPSRKQRAENERKAGERATADRMKKNGGDELANLDLGGPKAKSTKASRAGAKRLAADNEAMRKRDEQERRDKARRRANDESPMPGVIRKPSESDEIRRKEGERKQRGRQTAAPDLIRAAQNAQPGVSVDARNGVLIEVGQNKEGKRTYTVRGGGMERDYSDPRLAAMDAQGRSERQAGRSARKGRPKKTTTPAQNARAGRRREKERRERGITGPRSKPKGAKAGAVDDPTGRKLRAASKDPDTFASEIKNWHEAELRQEAKLLPNASPLYRLLIAELRRRTSSGHPASKARNRGQGLAESAGLFGR